MRSRLIQVGIQQFINYQLVPRARAQWLRKKGEHDHGRTEGRDRLTAKDDGRGSRGPDIALAKGVSASTLVSEDAGRPAVPGDDDSVGARLTCKLSTSRARPAIGSHDQAVSSRGCPRYRTRMAYLQSRLDRWREWGTRRKAPSGS